MDVDGRTIEEATVSGLEPDTYYRAAVAPIDGDDMIGNAVPSADFGRGRRLTA